MCRIEPARRLASVAEPPELPGVHHRWIDAGGLRVHVAEAGDPGGTPVLLLHGWPQHWFVWRRVIPALADHGYRLLCPDLRGFGWSDAPGEGYHPDTFARDQIALLDALEIERALVVGHDWGGFAALLLGMRFPERIERILGLNEPHPWPKLHPRLALESWRGWYGAVAAGPGMSARVHTRLARWILSHGHVSNPFSAEELASFVDQFTEPRRARAASSLYRSYFALLARGIRHGFDSEPLAVPTLLLFGEHDLFITKHMLPGHEPFAPEMQIELVPDSGHFIVDEKPELVIARALSHFGS
jgi:pimeloyl-ACP methyl ester carboxylesterase